MSRVFWLVLTPGDMGTCPSALPDCPAGTVLLTMHVTLLPRMTMHVFLLACYILIGGSWNILAECRKLPGSIWSAVDGAKPPSVPLTAIAVLNIFNKMWLPKARKHTRRRTNKLDILYLSKQFSRTRCCGMNWTQPLQRAGVGGNVGALTSFIYLLQRQLLVAHAPISWRRDRKRHLFPRASLSSAPPAAIQGQEKLTSRELCPNSVSSLSLVEKLMSRYLQTNLVSSKKLMSRDSRTNLNFSLIVTGNSTSRNIQ